MIEQFEEVKNIIDYERAGHAIHDAGVGTEENGSRIVTVILPTLQPDERNVRLTLYSRLINDGWFISVWAIYKQTYP